jgi:hypothetical protein
LVADPFTVAVIVMIFAETPETVAKTSGEVEFISAASVAARDETELLAGYCRVPHPSAVLSRKGGIAQTSTVRSPI